jgi:predicted RNA-binding protein YlqC (UPF0109 family)
MKQLTQSCFLFDIILLTPVKLEGAFCMSSIDQQFVEFIVKSLVSNPDAVIVERRIDEKGVLLELTVDPEDLGRVIGKRGATAQSLRTLLRALGTKNDARYNLKIVDNGTGGYGSDAGDGDSQSAGTASRAADDDQDDDSGSVVSKTRKELEELDDLDV